MDYIELKKLVELNYSQTEISKKLNCSKGKIKYWVKKFDIQKQTTEKNQYCKLCGNFIKNNIRNRSHCQSCVTRIRRYRTKQKAVNLLGGKCVRCGWSGNLAALEFHHPNDDKHFTISNISNKSWNVVMPEILKCELLCSNCHRIEHTKYGKDEKFMSVVNNYKGT